MAQKLAAWFLTPAGKKFSFGVACAASLGICSGCTLPHTFFLNKYKEIVHLYKYGMPARLSKDVLEKFNKAMDLLKMDEEYKALVKPFAVIGFDVFHAGTTYSKFGGIVGIPVNFSYNSVEEIEKNDIMILGEPVDWSKPEAQQLLRSLVLSDEAQIFAIAREIVSLNSLNLFLHTFYSSTVFIFMYGLGSSLNQKYNLYSRPLMLRGTMYSLIAMFGIGLYSLFTDLLQNNSDKRVDKELSELGEVFVEGGKEFYEKLLARNVALRKLMGKFGESQYTALGNEYFLIRQKRMPLVDRRDYFANKKSALVATT